ncbi:MAG: hypothetical protein ACK5M7_06865 [Draconibacterium sp.]
MKNTVAFIILLLPFALFAQEMNVMTFNIRYNNAGDGVNAWPNRVEMVNSMLNFYEPDVFGLQEALYGQVLDIQKGLHGYGWFGAGRDDGKKEGEFSPIFFNKSEFILLESGHFWLSENCEKPGLGWDATFLILILTIREWKPVKTQLC